MSGYLYSGLGTETSNVLGSFVPVPQFFPYSYQYRGYPPVLSAWDDFLLDQALGESAATLYESCRVTQQPSLPCHVPGQEALDVNNVHVPDQVVKLEQRTYVSKSAVFVPVALLYGQISLRNALSKSYSGLVNHCRPAFPSNVKLAQKISVRLLFEGHDDYHFQKNILRAHKRPLTRGELATIIAQVVQRFLNHEKTRMRKSLTYKGKEVVLDDLCLLGVQHVSQGSVQPILAIMSK